MGYSTPAVIELTVAGGLRRLSDLLPAAQPRQVRRVEITVMKGSNPAWNGLLRKSSDGIGWGSEWRVGDTIIQEASDLPREQVHLEEIWLGVDSDGGGFRCSVE